MKTTDTNAQGEHQLRNGLEVLAELARPPCGIAKTAQQDAQYRVIVDHGGVVRVIRECHACGCGGDCAREMADRMRQMNRFSVMRAEVQVREPTGWRTVYAAA